MTAVLESVMADVMLRAASIVGEFSPVIAWVGGIALGLGLIVFARDFLQGR